MLHLPFHKINPNMICERLAFSDNSVLPHISMKQKITRKALQQRVYVMCIVVCAILSLRGGERGEEKTHSNASTGLLARSKKLCNFFLQLLDLEVTFVAKQRRGSSVMTTSWKRHLVLSSRFLLNAASRRRTIHEILSLSFFPQRLCQLLCLLSIRSYL